MVGTHPPTLVSTRSRLPSNSLISSGVDVPVDLARPPFGACVLCPVSFVDVASASLPGPGMIFHLLTFFLGQHPRSWLTGSKVMVVLSF